MLCLCVLTSASIWVSLFTNHSLFFSLMFPMLKPFGKQSWGQFISSWKLQNYCMLKTTLNNHEWWACGWFSRGDPGHCQHILMKSRLCNDLMLMPLSKVACQLTLKFLHIFYVHLLIIWLRTSTHVILDSI